ncbi:MAG: hypothetical protein M1587_03300 [Thaumarchaeota archaeon]|nr:hypothetical protein [Nitrososphaerota archaeon]MDG6905336.1 hypothetical protein [Nitrososphaerota archaeon]
MSEAIVKESHPSKLVVVLTLIVGTIAGVIMSLIADAYTSNGSGSGAIQADAMRVAHVVMTTVSITLLVALVVIYARTYAATKAHFTLGIWMVLLALLLRSLLTYPVVLNFAEHMELLGNPLAPISDAFTVIAFALFLYLSLE